MARWASPMLAHYARLAPLESITTEFRRRSPLGPSLEMVSSLSRLTGLLDQQAAYVESHARQLEELEKAVAPKPYVCNNASNKWHVALVDDANTMPSLWKACCGWKFGSTTFARAVALPANVLAADLCSACCPLEKAEALQRVHRLERKSLREEPPCSCADDDSDDS